MSHAVETAKRVLAANTTVQYGVFGMIDSSGFFPPRTFLNQFLAKGNDPCDQDGHMSQWQPFTLSASDYLAVKEWWLFNHIGATEHDLGATCWDDWVQIILNS